MIEPRMSLEKTESAGVVYQFDELIAERDALLKEVGSLKQRVREMTQIAMHLSARRELPALSGSPSPLPSPSNEIPEVQTTEISTQTEGEVEMVEVEKVSKGPEAVFEANLDLVRRTKRRTIPAECLVDNSFVGVCAAVRVCFQSTAFCNVLHFSPKETLSIVSSLLEVVREGYTRYDACELPADTTHFTLLFHSPSDAVSFANSLHRDAMELTYPEALLMDPDLRAKFTQGGDSVLWKGLPVKISIVHGRPLVETETGSHFRYSGEVFARLDRLAKFTHFGETVVTKDVIGVLGDSPEVLHPGLTSVSPIQGKDPLDLRFFQILPSQLTARGSGLPKRDFSLVEEVGEVTAKEVVEGIARYIKREKVEVEAKPHPMGKVTFVFTDVPHFEGIQLQNHFAALDALDTANAVIHRCAAEQQAVAVQSNPTGHLFAFHDESSALQFCINTQTTLFDTDFSKEVEKIAQCASQADSSGFTYFNGLRVRMSLNSGASVCLPNKSGKLDYWGPSVMLAAKILKHGHGGQIICTEAAFAKTSLSGISCTSLPAVKIEGMSSLSELVEVYPAKLARRKFHFPQNPPPSAWEGSRYTSIVLLEASLMILQQSSVLTNAPDAELQNEIDAAHDVVVSTKQTMSRHIPPAGRVAFVFIEVAKSREFWDADSDGMLSASQILLEHVAEISSRYMGYIASARNGCYVTAFHDEEAAVLFALDLQEELLEALWPSSILELEGCKEQIINGARLWRGLHPCIAIHSGRPLCLTHPNTGKLDYWGPLINKGVSVGMLSERGEILLTSDVWQSVKCSKRLLDRVASGGQVGSVGGRIGVACVPLGAISVANLRDTIELFRITSRQLDGRKHSPVERDGGKSRNNRCSRWDTSMYITRANISTASEIMKKVGQLYNEQTHEDSTESTINAGPPVGTVTLVFTDIQSSTLLWEKDAKLMLNAIQLHNKIMRETIERHAGYEVKTEGDAFMVSFHREIDAVHFCLDAQKQLVTAPWQQGLLQLDPLTAVHKASLKSEGVGPDRHLWRGLRMRMGVHTGCPTCLPDPVSGRMDYWGPMVNKSARISSVATGGQIVCSAAVREKCKGDLHRSAVSVTDLKEFELKGIQGTTQVCERGG